MASLSNRDRVGKTLEILSTALAPYVTRVLESCEGLDWQQSLKPHETITDVQVQLRLMREHWDVAFRRVLDRSDRSFIFELTDIRNDWAHQKAFSSNDTDRALDTAARLCGSIAAPDQQKAISELREELQQIVFAERARNRTRYQTSIENQIQAGLQPWREVITPHPDVISGRYQQAEFAADLDQVRRGLGSPEYTDPIEFYRRTYITTGLRDLLRIALQRFNGQGGDPIIELQTNFGGGKTHSMLALYHLCSGESLANLPGLDEVSSALNIHHVPKASRAVLVGTAFSPAEPSRKPDGTVVQTLWGELAYQLGGAEAYARVANSDRQGVPPGAQDLAALMRDYSPCLILIDEWVAYARNLVSNPNLPAGTFDSQVFFAQALTEAVKQVETALLLVSVPQSTNEIGGSDGQVALDSLRNVINRVAFEWRPASGNESFEIVRRRLFEPITTREAGVNRDAVVRAFVDMYNFNKTEFPAETREPEYRDRLTAAYPIHPELFNRLYEDWSTLDRFQRTRGILRLLAKTIQGLWDGGSKDVMIMPSSMPIDDADVKNELLRYLDNQWEPIISQDVDGSASVPYHLDRENPNFGRVSACQRVARSLYIGTAPDANMERPGVGDQRVKLACVMPGEPIATFGDALRRLGDRGKYIQQDGDRYWIDTRPNLNRTAEDYREGYLRQREELIAELNSRLTQEATAAKRGDFSGLHPAPSDGSAVPDEPATRLVLVPAQYTHRKGLETSAARQWVEACLASRGNSPRQYANTLIFLAPDEKAIEALYLALADRRAWQRIIDNELELNLTASQKKQAIQKAEEAETAIGIRIPETWCYLLIPGQTEPGPHGAIWDERRLTSGKGSLGQRASEKCVQEDALIPSLGARRIRDYLNRFLWIDKPHVAVRDFVEWCRKYLYLPRVTSDQVILQALVNPQAALSGEPTFHLADGLDDTTGRYANLRHQASSGREVASLQQLIVKDEVAQRQLQADQAAAVAAETSSGTTSPAAPTAPGLSGVKAVTAHDPAVIYQPTAASPRNTTYTATLRLSPMRAGMQVGQFLDEVMSHLQTLPEAHVDMTLEVQVRVPAGIDEATARIVMENSAALRLDNANLD